MTYRVCHKAKWMQTQRNLTYEQWLEDQLTAALSEQLWIPVTEKLPPYNQPVNVYQPNWRGQLVTTAEFVGINESGYQFCFDYQSAEVDRHDFRYSVTKWRPLPDPPNEE